MLNSIEMDPKVKELYSTLDALKKKIANQRLKGYDIYLSELLLHYCATHIKMYDATKDKNDFTKCIYLFGEIEKESKFEELRIVENNI